MELRLRPLEPDDEAEFRAAHAATAAARYEFGLYFGESSLWTAYLAYLDALRRGEVAGYVRQDMLVAEVDGVIVGRTSLRYGLDEFLAHEGGHIGYVVVPQHRQRGYATEILRQSVAIAHQEGVGRILVTCDDDNVASAAVIERCGGRRDAELPLTPGPPPKRRYWFT